MQFIYPKKLWKLPTRKIKVYDSCTIVKINSDFPYCCRCSIASSFLERNEGNILANSSSIVSSAESRCGVEVKGCRLKSTEWGREFKAQNGKVNLKNLNFKFYTDFMTKCLSLSLSPSPSHSKSTELSTHPPTKALPGSWNFDAANPHIQKLSSCRTTKYTHYRKTLKHMNKIGESKTSTFIIHNFIAESYEFNA